MSEYIAQETTVSVLGVEFQGYKTENGSVVYSQGGAAKGLGITAGYLSKVLKSLRSGNTLKTLTGGLPRANDNISGNTLKVRTTSGIQKISTITKPELIALVDHLASKGNAQAKALVLANFAVILQHSLEYCLENINKTIKANKLDVTKYRSLKDGFVNIFG